MREGSDLTVVTFSKMVGYALKVRPRQFACVFLYQLAWVGVLQEYLPMCLVFWIDVDELMCCEESW